MSELTGKTLSDRYRLAEVIGRSILGTEVFKATDVQTGKPLIVKVIHKAITQNEEAVEKLKKDAAAAWQAEPLGVVEFINSGKMEDGTCFLVFEFLEGETLAARLEREIILPHDLALAVLLHVCSTLDKTHQAGVIHGDLKPENIFICKGAEAQEIKIIKLLDFGMAHIRDAHISEKAGEPGGPIYAPFYLAPEQVKKDSAADPKTDVYALGVILYQAVAGCVPFDGETIDETREKILKEQPRQPRKIKSFIPKEVSSLIMCAMDRDPESRFHSVGEFSVIIRNVIEVLDLIRRDDVDEESTFGSQTTGLYIRSGAAPELPLQKLYNEMHMKSDSAEEWQRVIDQLTQVLNSDIEPEKRIEAGKNLALIYDNKLFNTEEAKKVYIKILGIDERNREALDEMERIYTLDSNWPGLIDILKMKFEASGKPASRVELMIRIGEVFFAELYDLPMAAETYRQVVDGLDLTNLAALEALRSIYIQLERWEDYIEILSRLIPQAGPERKIQYYDEIAKTWIERLNNPAKAKEAYASILRIQPDNAIFASLMEQLSQMEASPPVEPAAGPHVPPETPSPPDEQAAPPQVAPAVEPPPALETAPPPETPPEPPGPVEPAEPPTPEAASELEVAPPWGKILPTHPPPAPHEAQLPPKPKEPSPVNEISPAAPPEPELPAADIDWIKEVENPAALIQKYLDEYESEKDNAKRSKLLIKTAQLYEVAIWDEEAASLLFQKAYLENYTDPMIVRELERITAKNGKWDELIGIVNEKIMELGNRIEAVPLYIHVGKWYTERLSYMEYALAVYGKAMQLDPYNIDVLSAIADLYRLAGQWDSYIHYLKIQVEKARTDKVKKMVLIKLGKTYHENLDRSEHAIETFRKVLQIDPLDEEALGCLEEIYRKWGLYKELAEIFEKKLEKMGPEGDQQKLRVMNLSLGELYEMRLKDSLAAVKCYQKVIEIEETDITALKGLERLFISMEQIRDLLDILEMQFKASSIDKEKIGLLGRTAAMYEKDFLKPDEAREKYEQILAMDPNNVEALENLQRLYRASKSWVSLVEALQRHAAVTPDEGKKIELFLSAGQILMDELKSLEKAMEAYQEVVDLNPVNSEGLRRLGALYEKLERYDDAVKTIQRLVNVLDPSAEKAEMLYRFGLLLETRLGRRDEAVDAFHEALKIVPEHLESLGALRTIYFERRQWDMASQIMGIEQKHTLDASRKSELLYARGRILADYQNKADEAIEYFKQAVEALPDNDEAARPLAEYYIGQQQLEAAVPLLETIVRKGAAREDKKEFLPYYLNLANIYVVLGNDEKAVEDYRGILEIDDGHVDATKGLAQALYRLGQWSESFMHFYAIIKNYPDSQSKKEKIDIYHHLGDIKLKMNEPRKALKLFEAILEIDRHHRRTLDTLIRIFEQYEDHEQVTYFKKLLAEVCEGDEKFDILVETGDLWQEKLHNSIKAISMYNDALKLQPSNRGILHKLMSLYSDTKQWPKAVKVLKKIADIEEDGERKSRYLNSIAIIFQSEVKNYESAIEYFNKALDADPENLKNFEAIEKLLTPARDWKKLEENYRTMLNRIKGQDKRLLEENLLHNLGEIYRTRLKNYEAAAEVFKIASDISPDNVERHEILTELYMLLPGKHENAAYELQVLIRKDPERIEHYMSLRRIYQEEEQWDKSFCLCQALSVLNKADEEERAFYEYYRMKEYEMPQAAIDNEGWMKNLFHPFEDIFIGKIFEVVMPIVFKNKVQPLKAYNLKKKDKRDLAVGPEPVIQVFGMVGRALNLLLPEVYISRQMAAPLQYAITNPPASVIGMPLLATNVDPHDLVFLIAKHLAYYRGEHYLRLLEHTVAGLTTLLLACIRTVSPSYPLAQDIENQVVPVVKIVRKAIQPVQMERLGRFVKAFIGSNSVVDLKRWVSSVELTACRAGLLLCNDLNTAVRAVSAEPQGISDMTQKEKVRELILFSVSEQYFRLREALGYKIHIAV